MTCPKCGLRQATEEIEQCNHCGAKFSKITISLWESAFASDAEFWWQEPRKFSKIIQADVYLKVSTFILIASAFSYILARKLSTDPFIIVLALRLRFLIS